MNLISDAWIPIQRKSGEEARIAPWEVTTRYDDDPVVALAAPRPDFNGALIQFLIGLLQTTCAPDSPRTWREWLRDPPTPENLLAKFEEISYAFKLDGDGPRFMQDLTLKLEDVKKRKGRKPKADEAIEDEEGQLSVDRLLIDAPGRNTREKNSDHFVKRGHITQLCPYCAALALFTLQTNAPGGGQGHRAGLRGGGPLTTVILGQTLWETICLNVLETNKFFSQSGNPQKSKGEDIFPWLGTTHTSEKGGKTERTTPLDVHPAQNFWAMPRRIRLISISEDKTNVCDLCGSSSNTVYRTYITKNYGVNYEGPWQHPLAPYYLNNLGEPKPIHPQSGGIGYRHWLGLVENTVDNKRIVARVIEQYRILNREDARLWAFGYEMDKRQQMKARCWYDTEMPIIFASEDTEIEYKGWVEAMILAAQQVAVEVRRHVKDALFRPKAEIRGDLSYIDGRFWNETESAFYESLYSIRDALNAGEDVTPLLREWYTTLTTTARRVFDDASQTGDFNAADPRRIAIAWNDLNRALARRRLRELLGLAA
jgi:CRISPR system Cascade subunit CasA